MSALLYRIAIGTVTAGLITGCDPSNVKSRSWVENHLPEAQECIARIEKDGIHNGRDFKDVHHILNKAHGGGWQDRQKFEIYLNECQNQTMFYGYQKREDSAELRAKALDTWDNTIRNDIEQRRKALRTASNKVVTDSSGSVRVDAYYLKKGGTIHCSTKVTDSGTFMNCDGQP